MNKKSAGCIGICPSAWPALRILFCLLFLTTLLGCSGTTALAYNFEAKLGSGTEGNISWEAWNYDFEWTLKVSGSGRMNDYPAPNSYYASSSAPAWFRTVEMSDGDRLNLGHYMHIEIGSGITYIGSYAFSPAGSQANDIGTVTIPASVTEIGTGAFSGQNRLDRVIIPESVVKIGEKAFEKSVTVVCSSRSAAYQYALANGLGIELTDLTLSLTLDGGKSSVVMAQGDTLSFEVTSNVPGVPARLGVGYTGSLNQTFAIDNDARTFTATDDGLTVEVYAYAYGTESNRCSVRIKREYELNYVEDLFASVRADDVDYVDNSMNPTHYTEGTSVKLKNPKRKGYTFLGWGVSQWINDEGCFRIVKVTTVKDDSYELLGSWAKTAAGPVSKVKLTNKKGGKLVISWPKVNGANGYQVQYSTKSSFKKSATKSKTLTKKKLTVTGLKKKKTVYVRVRAYRKDSTGAKVYGSWSKKAKLKITK